MSVDIIARGMAAGARGGVLQAAYIDFTTKPDGAPPGALDSGQAVNFHQNVTGREPAISGGRLVVHNRPASGGLADYYQSDLGAGVQRVGVEWTQPAGSDDGNGNVTYAAWGGYYQSNLGLAVPKSWVHLSFVAGVGITGTAYWSIIRGQSGANNIVQVKTKTFANPAADGATPWTSEAILEAAAGMAYAWLPDGSIMTISDAEIAAACAALGVSAPTLESLADASVIMCEHFCMTAGDTAKFGGFTAMWGETATSAPQDFRAKASTPLAATKRALALQAKVSAAPAPPPALAFYIGSSQVSIPAGTSAANVGGTSNQVTALAGPSGKIIYQVAAWYEWSGTDTLYWRMWMGGSTYSAATCAQVGAAGDKKLVTQTLVVSGLSPGQSYTATLQHNSLNNAVAMKTAGPLNASQLPPWTILALPS